MQSPALGRVLRQCLRRAPVRSPLMVAGLAAILGLTACSSGGSGGANSAGGAAGTSSSTKIVIASTSPPELDVFPIYYANETHLWQKYGLQVTFSDLTPAAGTAALISGSVDVFLDGTGVLKAAADTHKVTVAGTYSQVPLDIVVNPKVAPHLKAITSAADVSELKGLTYGGTSQGSLVDVAFRAVLAQAHVDPIVDLKMVYLGAGALAALERGSIGVTVLAPSQLPLAKAAGMRVIGSLNHISDGKGLYTMVGVNQSYLKAHGQLVKRFATAYRAALKQARAHPSATISYAAKAVSASPALTKKAYALQNPYTVLEPVPASTLKFDLQKLSASDPAAKFASPSSVADNAALG